MNPKKPSRKSPARLGAYLAAGLGASAIATPNAEAEIVGINIGPGGFNIGGINGGLAVNSDRGISDFPFVGAGLMSIYNDSSSLTGLGGSSTFQFAAANSNASPRKFTLYQVIDTHISFTNDYNYSVFKNGATESPDFGPGSYMGFQTNNGHYGWLEVTWNSATDQFQILSGAYETVPGVAINAGIGGSSPAAVPEPSTWAMSALLAGGVGFTVWRRRRAAAQAKAQADLQAA